MDEAVSRKRQKLIIFLISNCVNSCILNANLIIFQYFLDLIESQYMMHRYFNLGHESVSGTCKIL